MVDAALPHVHLLPILTDGVVTLRALEPADIDALVEQCTDPQMRQWTTVPRDYPRESAQGRVERVAQQWRQPGGWRTWAIEWIDEGVAGPGVDGSGAAGARYAGMIDLRPGESRSTASLGFGLHPAARGRGLMTRAVRLVAQHAFEQQPWGVHVTRVHWRAIVGNWASRRVAWACGFTMHGTLPETHVNPADPNGPALDAWHMSLATGEPMTPTAPWFVPPVLEADGIRLRPWREGDVEAIEPRDDPEHWMPARSVLSPEMFAGWLLRRHELMAEGRAVEWCVADADSDRALGGVVVFAEGPMTGDVAELGYQLFPSARGRGVAQAAARLAIRHGLTSRAEGGLGLRRLVAETAADNRASNRVLEANGFTAYGREHAVDPLPDGTFGDGLHWELLPR